MKLSLFPSSSPCICVQTTTEFRVDRLFQIFGLLDSRDPLPESPLGRGFCRARLAAAASCIAAAASVLCSFRVFLLSFTGVVCHDLPPRPLARIPHLGRVQRGRCNFERVFGASRRATTARGFVGWHWKFLFIRILPAPRLIFRRTPRVFKITLCVRTRANPTDIGFVCGFLAQDGTVLPGAGPHELILSNGETMKLRGRALWILRNVDAGPVDVTKVCDCTRLGVSSLDPDYTRPCACVFIVFVCLS